jgi:hypothetical protein
MFAAFCAKIVPTSEWKFIFNRNECSLCSQHFAAKIGFFALFEKIIAKRFGAFVK